MGNTENNQELEDQSAVRRDADRFRWLCSQIELGNLVISHQTASGTSIWRGGTKAVIEAIDSSISVAKKIEQLNSNTPKGW